MLAAGDADLMRVVLDYYANAEVFLSQRTQAYFNHSGAWTTETHHLSGAYCGMDYGCSGRVSAKGRGAAAAAARDKLCPPPRPPPHPPPFSQLSFSSTRTLRRTATPCGWKPAAGCTWTRGKFGARAFKARDKRTP